MRLESEKFHPVVDSYYKILGWDVDTGWPTHETLSALGLDIHEEMVAGALSAQSKLPQLPPITPIHD